MEDQYILRQLTNTPQEFACRKQKADEFVEEKLQLSDCISLSKKELDFGECLPGSIHEQPLVVTIKK